MATAAEAAKDAERSRQSYLISLEQAINAPNRGMPVGPSGISKEAKAGYANAKSTADDFAAQMEEHRKALALNSEKQKKDVQELADANIAGTNASQARDQQIADTARQSNALFGVSNDPSSRLAQLATSAASDYENSYAALAAADKVANLNPLDDTGSWLLGGVLHPAFVAQADNLKQRAKLTEGEINRIQTQAANQTTLLQAEIPKTTLEMAAAANRQTLAKATFDQDVIDQKQIMEDTNYRAKVYEAKMASINSTIAKEAAELNQKNVYINNQQQAARFAADQEHQKLVMKSTLATYKEEQVKEQVTVETFINGARLLGKNYTDPAIAKLEMSKMSQGMRDTIMTAGFSNTLGATPVDAIGTLMKVGGGGKELSSQVRRTRDLLNNSIQKNAATVQGVQEALKDPAKSGEASAAVVKTLIEGIRNPGANKEWQVLRPGEMLAYLKLRPTEVTNKFPGLNPTTLKYLTGFAATSMDKQPDDLTVAKTIAIGMLKDKRPINEVAAQITAYFRGGLNIRNASNDFAAFGLSQYKDFAAATGSYKVNVPGFLGSNSFDMTKPENVLKFLNKEVVPDVIGSSPELQRQQWDKFKDVMKDLSK